MPINFLLYLDIIHNERSAYIIKKHHVFIILCLKKKTADDASDDLTPDFFGDINISNCSLNFKSSVESWTGTGWVEEHVGLSGAVQTVSSKAP